MTSIQIHTQDSSRPEGIDYDALTIGNAQPTNLAGETNAWVAEAKSLDGSIFSVTYGFSADEAGAAGEDASSLPWDAAHVVRIVRKD